MYDHKIKESTQLSYRPPCRLDRVPRACFVFLQFDVPDKASSRYQPKGVLVLALGVEMPLVFFEVPASAVWVFHKGFGNWSCMQSSCKVLVLVVTVLRHLKHEFVRLECLIYDWKLQIAEHDLTRLT